MNVPTPEAESKSAARDARPLIAPLLIVCILQVYLVTLGLRGFSAERPFGVAFDSLAASLLRGDATVVPGSIEPDGTLRADGATVMYFGIWPAIARLPLLVAGVPVGHLSKVTVLFASFTTLFGLWLALHALFVKLAVDRRVGISLERWWILGWGVGSPLLFLTAWPQVYCEAIAWGLAGFAMTIGFLFAGACEYLPKGRCLAWIALGVVISVLSRLTFGLTSLAFASASAIWLFDGRTTLGGSRIRARVVPLTIGALGAAVHLWYNDARYGSPLVFADTRPFMGVLDAVGGFYNVDRIPTAILNYFGVRPEYFSGHAPYVLQPKALYLEDSLYVSEALNWEYREGCTSLLVASPWLVLSVILGSVLGPLRFDIAWRKASTLAFVPGIAACLFQAGQILSFMFVTQRLTCELLPIFSVAALAAFAVVVRAESRLLRATLVAALVVSMFATVASTLDWVRADGVPMHGLPRSFAYDLETIFNLLPAF